MFVAYVLIKNFRLLKELNDLVKNPVPDCQ